MSNKTSKSSSSRQFYKTLGVRKLFDFFQIDQIIKLIHSTSNNLPIEEIDILSKNVQAQIIGIMYKFSLIFTFIRYFAYDNITLDTRIAFVYCALSNFFRINWSLPNSSLDEAKYYGIIDTVILSILNILLNYNSKERYKVVTLYIMIFCSVYPGPAFQKFLLSGFIITSFSVISLTEGINNWRFLLLLTILYIFLVVIGQFYASISLKFCDNLMVMRKDTEKSLQDNNMFVASLSHDLKNPLGVILGCVDLLKNSKCLSMEDKEKIKCASYSGRIMQYLIANILDTAKIATGKFDIERIPMDINDVIDKVASIEGELAKAKNIHLYKKVLGPLPKLVYGDEMRLSQVLINIVGNSIKFTNKGYVAFVLTWVSSIDEAKAKENNNNILIPAEEYFLGRQGSVRNCIKKRNFTINEESWNFEIEELKDPVCDKMEKYQEDINHYYISRVNSISFNTDSPMDSVKYKPISPQRKEMNIMTSRDDSIRLLCSENITNESNAIVGDSGLLIIDIIDTGIGIREEEQERLFKPFSQANSDVKMKYGGTGLGLSITKQLISMMSGFIEFNSIYKKGTRFTISLPYKIVKSRNSGTTAEIVEENCVEDAIKSYSDRKSVV